MVNVHGLGPVPIGGKNGDKVSVIAEFASQSYIDDPERLLESRLRECANIGPESGVDIRALRTGSFWSASHRF